MKDQVCDRIKARQKEQVIGTCSFCNQYGIFKDLFCYINAFKLINNLFTWSFGGKAYDNDHSQ